MPHLPTHRRGLLLCFALMAPLAAQSDRDTCSSASRSFFLLNTEHGHGGRATSTTYALDASLGSGAVAQATTSTTYALAGGFFGSAATPASGQPWLAGVTPRFVTLRGATQVTVHGTELDLGGRPTVTIGGQVATLVGTAARDRATVNFPIQPVPGWQPVRLTTASGATELPRGIGVLPMIYTDPAAASDKGFVAVFKGSPGDRVVWALSISALPGPLAMGGVWHGLRLDPRIFVMMPVLNIVHPSGELHLPIPPTPIPVTLFAQGVFATANPGYGPAAFSNLLVVRP